MVPASQDLRRTFLICIVSQWSPGSSDCDSTVVLAVECSSMASVREVPWWKRAVERGAYNANVVSKGQKVLAASFPYAQIGEGSISFFARSGP